MKKLVLFAAVAAVVGLSACKKTEAPAEVAPEETIETVVEEAPAADTTVVVEETAPVAE
ncbi:MAG: hypothetical protein LBG77_06210 [Dysgonamonadaceae bacterium]|jgi:Na+-transporting methylmalonyl-CoA/oxaloacetate decarboxylase gamma subunit|nr:hypothetical protein [Dysgonamonadaceae bacterium]